MTYVIKYGVCSYLQGLLKLIIEKLALQLEPYLFNLVFSNAVLEQECDDGLKKHSDA